MFDQSPQHKPHLTTHLTSSDPWFRGQKVWHKGYRHSRNRAEEGVRGAGTLTPNAAGLLLTPPGPWHTPQHSSSDYKAGPTVSLFCVCRVGCDSSPTFISLCWVVALVLKCCPGTYSEVRVEVISRLFQDSTCLLSALCPGRTYKECREGPEEP